MIISRTKRTFFLALFAVIVPAMASGQVAAEPDPTSAANQEMQALLLELQQLHQQLEEFQLEALADPALSARQEALGEEIQVAMADLDPMMDQRMARLEEVMAEGRAAELSGDTQTRDELGAEFQQLQQHFMAIQESVITEPPLASKVQEFQAQLEATMIRMNPEAEAMIARLREVEVQMERIMGGS